MQYVNDDTRSLIFSGGLLYVAMRSVILYLFGFAWLRRFDENNVDPNRDFLLAGERHEGSPPHYADLDKLLNPQRPPSAVEPFVLKVRPAIARHGMPTLRQATAARQFEFPQGLFFGGAGPSAMHKLLMQHMPRWLKGSQSVMHLDFHTGLGPKGSCKLLIDYPLSPSARARLTSWFGADSFEASSPEGLQEQSENEIVVWSELTSLFGAVLFCAGLSSDVWCSSHASEWARIRIG